MGSGLIWTKFAGFDGCSFEGATSKKLWREFPTLLELNVTIAMMLTITQAM